MKKKLIIGFNVCVVSFLIGVNIFFYCKNEDSAFQENYLDYLALARPIFVAKGNEYLEETKLNALYLTKYKEEHLESLVLEKYALQTDSLYRILAKKENILDDLGLITSFMDSCAVGVSKLKYTQRADLFYDYGDKIKDLVANYASFLNRDDFLAEVISSELLIRKNEALSYFYQGTVSGFRFECTEFFHPVLKFDKPYPRKGEKIKGDLEILFVYSDAVYEVKSIKMNGKFIGDNYRFNDFQYVFDKLGKHHIQFQLIARPEERDFRLDTTVQDYYFWVKNQSKK